MASRKQQRSSLFLPFELVEEILYKIPIESVVRFKSVCKEWFAFFNDKSFINKHLNLSKERIIGVDQKSFQIFNVEPKALLSLPTPDELHNYTVGETIHCDGLLLLCKCIDKWTENMFSKYFYADTRTRKLAVWNPVLSRVIWIEPSSSYKARDLYGFGYDNVSRDNYKILRIGDKTLEGKSLEVEIYEFKSKLWRSINATFEWNSWWGTVSMCGNVYWIAQKKFYYESKMENFIQSFDFCTETFKPICCVPDGIDFSHWSSVSTLALSGCGGDKLSLLQRHEHEKIEVWVTSKLVDDGIVSWSKYFKVTLNPLIVHSNFVTNFILKTNKSKIMLWCEERSVRKKDIYTTVYELGDEGEIKKQVEFTRRGGDDDKSCNGYVPKWDNDRYCNVYVPSLVPVPQ